MNYKDLITQIESDYNVGYNTNRGGGRCGFSGNETQYETLINNRWYHVELIHIHNLVKVKKIILKDRMLRKQKLEKLNAL